MGISNYNPNDHRDETYDEYRLRKAKEAEKKKSEATIWQFIIWGGIIVGILECCGINIF